MSIIIFWWYFMLKKRRKKLGISQRKLAKKLKVDRSYLSKVENHKFNNVNMKFITKISKELNLNPVEVFLFFYKMNNDKTKD